MICAWLGRQEMAAAASRVANVQDRSSDEETRGVGGLDAVSVSPAGLDLTSSVGCSYSQWRNQL